MKKRIILHLGLVLLLAGFCFSCNRESSKDLSNGETAQFNSTPELYDLTSEWASIYNTIHPEAAVDVVAVPGRPAVENLTAGGKLSFVTGEFDSQIYANSLWNVVVGRDVIVPVINAGNPNLEEIARRGISPAGLLSLIDNPGTMGWGELLEKGGSEQVNLFVTDDRTLKTGMAEFLNSGPVTFAAASIIKRGDLIRAVGADRYSIGLCKIADVIEPTNGRLAENLRILPIDINGNGRIDYKENVYSDLNAFMRGVWIGKYPGSLSKNIYMVSSMPPSGVEELAFLKWIVTSGQGLLDNHGYSDLQESEQLAQVKWIDGIAAGTAIDSDYINAGEPSVYHATLPRILVVLLAVFLAIAIAYSLFITVVRILDLRYSADMSRVSVPRGIFNVDHLDSPAGLYYDKSHTWAFLDKDGLVKVGIDDFLQNITGPLTRVKMKLPGERIRKGKIAVSIIQDGKQLDICSPVSGTIKEQNKLLDSNSSILNTSPYSEGWVYKIEPSNWLKEVQFMFMGKNYREWLKSEYLRLKEFFTESVRPGAFEFAHVLQDGGELKERILEEMGPEVWEDFQTNFIDLS